MWPSQPLIEVCRASWGLAQEKRLDESGERKNIESSKLAAPVGENEMQSRRFYAACDRCVTVETNAEDLRDARILVAEDNMILAYDMVNLLRNTGADVLGPARTLAETLALAESDSLSCAVFDVNLGQELVFPAAQVLKERGVGIVFQTGQGEPERLKREWPEAQVLIKPVPSTLLIQAIRDTCWRPTRLPLAK